MLQLLWNINLWERLKEAYSFFFNEAYQFGIAQVKNKKGFCELGVILIKQSESEMH